MRRGHRSLTLPTAGDKHIVEFASGEAVPSVNLKSCARERVEPEKPVPAELLLRTAFAWGHEETA